MDLVPGNKYSVVVEMFLPFGAVVRLDDSTTQLIHVSRISKDYVHDPADYLNLGESYIAEAVMSDRRGAELSFIHLGLTNKEQPADRGDHRAKFVARQARPKQTVEGRPLASLTPAQPKPSGETISQGTPDLEKMIEKMDKDFKAKIGKSPEQMRGSARKSPRVRRKRR